MILLNQVEEHHFHNFVIKKNLIHKALPRIKTLYLILQIIKKQL